MIRKRDIVNMIRRTRKQQVKDYELIQELTDRVDELEQQVADINRKLEPKDGSSNRISEMFPYHVGK